MTAEIALLNRSALALAADSAVTLRIGSSYKTYNTAEKIFEFSCNQPIALMIYNNVDFVGVPLDVIIRKHRVDCSHSFETLKDAADEFIRYLLEFKRKPNQEGSYLAAVLVDSYSSIFKEFTKISRRAVADKSMGKPHASLADELVNLIDEQIALASASPLPGFLVDKSIEDFDREYGEVCDQAIKIVFKSFVPARAHRVKLHELAFALVKSSEGSDVLTGLVFGGFGTKDLFPTLHYLEMDGIYFDQLKIISRSEIDIDRDGDFAAIVPFAQKEMAERFIFGIDKDLESRVAEFVSSAVEKIVESKPDAFSGEEVSAIHEAVSTSFETTMRRLIGEERESILDIVNFMSKKELAEMAHALVELTSAKRRFSTAQETVGGPIDVAIVSRSEGFIWIRRKHYFDAEANPGYFARVFPARRTRRDQ
jgi:hypothetical protein